MTGQAWEERRVYRAMRSLVYNRNLKPLVERRIEKAETRILTYMGLRGLKELTLGYYHVLSADGYLDVEVLPGSDEGWMQATYMREEER
jgi:hypothetical protein